MSLASSPNKRNSSLAQPVTFPDFSLVQPSLRSKIVPPQSLYSTPTFSESSSAWALMFKALSTFAMVSSCSMRSFSTSNFSSMPSSCSSSTGSSSTLSVVGVNISATPTLKKSWPPFPSLALAVMLSVRLKKRMSASAAAIIDGFLRPFIFLPPIVCFA